MVQLQSIAGFLEMPSHFHSGMCRSSNWTTRSRRENSRWEESIQLFISVQQWLFSDNWAGFPSVWVIYWRALPPRSLLLCDHKAVFITLLLWVPVQFTTYSKSRAAKLFGSRNLYHIKTSAWKPSWVFKSVYHSSFICAKFQSSLSYLRY